MKNVNMNQVTLSIFRETSDEARYPVWDMKGEVHLAVRAILVAEIRSVVRLNLHREKS